MIDLINNSNRTIPVEDGIMQYPLRELTPGATYQVQAFTVFDNKESLAYTSRNFTTSKVFSFYKRLTHEIFVEYTR